VVVVVELVEVDDVLVLLVEVELVEVELVDVLDVLVELVEVLDVDVVLVLLVEVVDVVEVVEVDVVLVVVEVVHAVVVRHPTTGGHGIGGTNDGDSHEPQPALQPEELDHDVAEPNASHRHGPHGVVLLVLLVEVVVVVVSQAVTPVMQRPGGQYRTSPTLETVHESDGVEHDGYWAVQYDGQPNPPSEYSQEYVDPEVFVQT